MEDNLGLEVLFKGYYRVENDAVKAIWRDGLIIPDANVLLDLYRYSDDARDTFLNLLNNHNSRVWLPHQAAQEYFKNRPSVINEQSKNYDATLSDINDLYNSFNQKNRHPFLPPHLLGEVEEMFKKLNTYLENTKSSHIKRLNVDEIQNKITEIFGHRVGNPFPSDKLKKIFEEGKYRYQSKIPPGYEDAQKNDNEKDLVGQQRRYGDLIMWKQIIAHAREHKIPVLLITEDTKEDWWLRCGGRTLSARPELFKEFHDRRFSR